MKNRYARSEWRRCPRCLNYWVPSELKDTRQKAPPYPSFYKEVVKAVCKSCSVCGRAPPKVDLHVIEEQDITRDLEGLT